MDQSNERGSARAEDAARRDPAGDPDVEDLKATEDSLRADVRRLSAVEDEKRALAPEDPRVDRLSDEAVELADRIQRQTLAEQQLSEEIG